MAPLNGDFSASANNIKGTKLKTFKQLKKSTISKVYEKKSNSINPVAIIFQNGALNEKYVSKFNVSLTPTPNGYTDVEVQTSYGHKFANSNFNLVPEQKQIIAIRNRKTNKVKLVEIDCATLINDVLHDKGNDTITYSEYSKDIKTLHKSFGGKKIVTQIEQREKINVNPDLIAHEVTQAVEGVNFEHVEASNNMETESISNLLPPCNRSAAVVSEVYKLDEILEEEELEALKNEMGRKEEFKPLEYSEFFRHSVEEVKKSGHDANKLAGLLFAEILIQFLKIPSKKISSKNTTFCSFSNAIHSKLLNEFCIKTESSLSRSMTMRDKTLCYIIAVTLICCRYQINLKSLATAVSVNLTRLSRLARIVGATPASKDDHIFILKLPLPSLPKVSTAKGRRK